MPLFDGVTGKFDVQSKTEYWMEVEGKRYDLPEALVKNVQMLETALATTKVVHAQMEQQLVEAKKEASEAERERQLAVLRGNNFYVALVRELEPYFPKNSRDLEYDVLVRTLRSMMANLHVEKEVTARNQRHACVQRLAQHLQAGGKEACATVGETPLVTQPVAAATHTWALRALGMSDFRVDAEQTLKAIIQRASDEREPDPTLLDDLLALIFGATKVPPGSGR